MNSAASASRSLGYPRAIARLYPAILPWLAFIVILYWAWGPRDLVHTVPHYGDVLEIVSGISWFGQAVTHGLNPLIYPQNYFPTGWHLATHGGGPILFVLLWPLALLGGTALAFNLAALATHAVAFGGALALARRHLALLPATVVALGFTFWGLRWNQGVGGRLNIMLGSALLPWLAWSVERALSAPRRRQTFAWLILAGVLWTVTIMVSLYFAFIAGLVIAIWLLFSRPDPAPRSQARWLYLVLVCALGLLFSSPWLYLNWRETKLVDPPFYSVFDLNFWGASLNALWAPSVAHPWLGWLGQLVYKGPPTWEQGTTNLGPLACLAALAGAVLARPDRAWRPALPLAICGLVLSLGLTLHWDGQPLQVPALRPLNEWLWRLGDSLKPSFFFGTQSVPPLQDGIPLPGLLLTALVPFTERGRLFARYALAGSLGLYLLVGLTLARVRRTWLQALFAGLLIFEIIPPQMEMLPFPPPAHPAYTWLSQQSIPGEGIAEVQAVHPTALTLQMGGELLLSTFYHHQSSVTGASGVAPRSQAALYQWFVSHPHPFWHPDFATVMRSYRVRYLVLSMAGDWDKDLWQEAAANKELRRVNCFPPPEGISPWNVTMCILEVKPAAPTAINLLLHDGWSGKEDWGVWAEGTTAFAQWETPQAEAYRLTLTAFPQCVPGQKQRLTLQVNQRVVLTHEWENCDPWTGVVEVPAALVRIGANDVSFSSAYAVSPTPAPGSPADSRKLSLGYTRLFLEPAP